MGELGPAGLAGLQVSMSPACIDALEDDMPLTMAFQLTFIEQFTVVNIYRSIQRKMFFPCFQSYSMSTHKLILTCVMWHVCFNFRESQVLRDPPG